MPCICTCVAVTHVKKLPGLTEEELACWESAFRDCFPGSNSSLKAFWRNAFLQDSKQFLDMLQFIFAYSRTHVCQLSRMDKQVKLLGGGGEGM